MSSFDAVYVKCPKCKVIMTLQSKAGKCNLDEFALGAPVPSVIALDLDGTHTCEVCDKDFIVFAPLPDKVVLEVY